MKNRLIIDLTFKHLVFACITLCSIGLQSCTEEDSSLRNETSSSTNVNKFYNKNSQIKTLDINNPEILNLKNRLNNATEKNSICDILDEVKMGTICWNLAYKVEQGKLKGIFVPLKNSTKTDIRILASLYINGEMKEYIIQRKSTDENDNTFTGEVNFSEINGKVLRQDKYRKGLMISKPKIKNIRLKSNANETINGIGKFDDYDVWFDTASPSQRFANSSGVSIWVKSEESSACFELKPNEWTDKKIDGYSLFGQVTKVTNGYNTGACGSSGCFTSSYNILTFAYFVLVGGPKDRAWLYKLQADGDHGWDVLFEK